MSEERVRLTQVDGDPVLLVSDDVRVVRPDPVPMNKRQEGVPRPTLVRTSAGGMFKVVESVDAIEKMLGGVKRPPKVPESKLTGVGGGVVGPDA